MRRLHVRFWPKADIALTPTNSGSVPDPNLALSLCELRGSLRVVIDRQDLTGD